MLVRLERPLRPKPEPAPKPLRPYMSKACVTIVDKGRLSDEITDLLKSSAKSIVHVCKRRVRRRR
jgi:hypothetical protein